MTAIGYGYPVGVEVGFSHRTAQSLSRSFRSLPYLFTVWRTDPLHDLIDVCLPLRPHLFSVVCNTLVIPLADIRDQCDPTDITWCAALPDAQEAAFD